MASRPIELPGVSGAGWLRTFTGPVKARSVKQVREREGSRHRKKWHQTQSRGAGNDHHRTTVLKSNSRKVDYEEIKPRPKERKAQRSSNLTREQMRNRRVELTPCYAGMRALYWEVKSCLEAVRGVVLRRR